MTTFHQYVKLNPLSSTIRKLEVKIYCIFELIVTRNLEIHIHDDFLPSYKYLPLPFTFFSVLLPTNATQRTQKPKNRYKR